MIPGPVDVEIKNILESFRKEMVDRFEKAERKTTLKFFHETNTIF